jgi:hypothetical protein
MFVWIQPGAILVGDDFSRIDFVPKIFGDGLRDFGRPRVKAVDHKRLHRDRLVGALEGVHIEPGLFPVFVFAVVCHFPAPSAITRWRWL